MSAQKIFSRRFFLENAVYIALLFLLTVACIKILLPFLVALIWSVIILIAVWPVYQLLCRKLGGRSKLSAVLVVCMLILALIMPLAFMVMAIIEILPTISDTAAQFAHYKLSSLPPWLAQIPVLGQQLADFWISVQNNLSGVFSRTQPFIQDILSWSLRRGASLVRGVLEISLAIVIAGVLLVSGDKIQYYAKHIIIRLSGRTHADLSNVVVRTIRGIATGVIGTALLQSILATIGLIIAGVPGALALGFACLILAIAQLPTILVWLPATIWLFAQHAMGLAIFLGLWGLLLVSTIDNFIKPYLISHEAGMPLSLIFLGVFGGLLSMGIIGLFVGPTMLAIAYTLIVHWLKIPTTEDYK
ncbi:MAG: AI-2E family transporter [Neisseriales bacterium]|nr:MAG: AI-2E family transporter [Neisseriales bacterium]